MEKQNKSHKNGSTNRITTWIIILFSFSQSFSAVKGNGETTMYSSGLDETTTYKEKSTYITITPFLSAAPTTLSEGISTTHWPLTTPQLCQTEFIQYGTDVDKQFPMGDDNFLLGCPSIEVPINSKNLGCFHMATNGYITNGIILPYYPEESELSAERITFMPLWTDIDGRFGGHIYYQIYDSYADTSVNKLQEILGDIKNLFAHKAQGTFSPVWALKITWKDVVPYAATTNEEKLTFQFILATDGTVTYMAYIYDSCSFSWDTSRRAIMGYVYPGYSYYHRDSLNPEIFDLGLKSNTQNKIGVFLFELSSQYTTNYAQRCLQWKDVTSLPSQLAASSAMPCPCTLWQAQRDNRFSIGENRCYYLTFLDNGYSKVCCYGTLDLSPAAGLYRGNLQVYSAILSEDEWFLNDYQPYADCCLGSDYCSLYNTYRPNDMCEGYEPLIQRFGFGEPHIQTLDGYSYTFNGLGEFELLNINSATDTNKVLMKIQCRTKEVGANGNKATAFSAFVIKSGNVTIQISSRDSTNEMKIFSGINELTSFYTDVNYTWNENPFYVSTNTAANNSYIIRHNSQSTIVINLRNGLLEFGINLGYKTTDVKTNGLLGTYNKNDTDDLETPTGQLISANHTEKYIYYHFGMLWKVNNSIFHYENSETQATYDFPKFTPSFLVIDKTTNDYQEAIKICDITDRSCIYDYLVTLRKDIATNTRQIEKEIEFNTLLTNLTSPTFNGTNSLTVTVNETLVHVVNVKSTQSNLTLSIIDKESCSISISDTKVEISVHLNKVSPVKAAFQVIDQYKMSTPLFNLTVMVCPLCEHGTCDKTSVSLISSYQYTCNCSRGWRGDYCDVDVRCEPLSCPCTGPDNNYTCACPAGYEFKGKCIDINECTTNTSNCSQNCMNTMGSYKCSCKEGYKLVNKTQCINIDECKDLLNTCDQKCNDTDGSYKCDCYAGYKMNGTKCILETDVCNNATDCSNASGCTLKAGKPACFCKSGYTFNNTLKKCEDVNECDTVTCNNGACVNTKGSYFCSCSIGTKLATDRRTCEGCGHNKWGENCTNTCSGANCKTCLTTTGCVCTQGYKGVDCSDDINECNDTNYCNTSISICKNSIGSASCICLQGFQLDGRGICVDIDECTQTNDCSRNAVCTNTIGNHTCTCKNGYKGDGIQCADVDECAQKNPCSDICVNQVGSFSCSCTGNSKLQDDRKTCKEVNKSSGKDRLYIIIFGSIAGAIVTGLLVTLWFYCFGCCACCRRRHPHFISTLQQDRFNVRDAFGYVSSSLRGQLVHNEPFAADAGRASKYLEDWVDFSPYSENNRQETGADNPAWEDLGVSSSSWGNVIHHFDNGKEFRIERPKVRP